MKMNKIVRLDGKTYRVKKVWAGVGASDAELKLPKSIAKKVGRTYIPVKNLSIRTRLANKLRKRK